MVSGASDIDVYRVCKEQGWSFGIDTSLHGKVYVIDQINIFLGSANLTQKGLSIGFVGNNEFGTKIMPNQVDLNKFNSYISEQVVWCNDQLFSAIEKEIENSRPKNDGDGAGWSSEVKSLLTSSISSLWVLDLPRCGPKALLNADVSDEDVRQDLSLLGVDDENISDILLVNQVKQTRFYGWLVNLLKVNGECRFGKVTSELHDALIDDPKPYRKEVKEYIVNIFSWMEFLTDDFIVDRPNYSQVARLKE